MTLTKKVGKTQQSNITLSMFQPIQSNSRSLNNKSIPTVECPDPCIYRIDPLPPQLPGPPPPTPPLPECLPGLLPPTPPVFELIKVA